MIDPDEECAGLFRPCINDVTHHLESGDGRPPIPLCTEHWDWTMALEQTLKADPKLAEDFGHAIDVVKAGGIQ